jgi:hypothetical protein
MLAYATLPDCTRSLDNNILLLSGVKLVPILFLDTSRLLERRTYAEAVCRSWRFLLGIYEDAVCCPKTRIASDGSHLRADDQSHS